MLSAKMPGIWHGTGSSMFCRKSHAVSFCRYNALGGGELGNPVNADKGKALAFGCLHLGNVDVKDPDGVALENLALGSVALDMRQTREAMSLRTPLQG
ncbi:MAG: hypothetical protein ACK4NH_01395 [Gemmobacter sp.]